MLILRAIALILSGDISVGYGVRREYLSSSGFSCLTLWLFYDQHGTAVSQKPVCLESVLTKCTFFL